MPHPHKHYSHRVPWLRAAVLGAMDGLGSIAALLLGVQGGAASRRAILLAGASGAVAGALSMGVSEYVSVASQRDAQREVTDPVVKVDHGAGNEVLCGAVNFVVDDFRSAGDLLAVEGRQHQLARRTVEGAVDRQHSVAEQRN